MIEAFNSRTAYERAGSRHLLRKYRAPFDDHEGRDRKDGTLGLQPGRFPLPDKGLEKSNSRITRNTIMGRLIILLLIIIIVVFFLIVFVLLVLLLDILDSSRLLSN